MPSTPTHDVSTSTHDVLSLLGTKPIPIAKIEAKLPPLPASERVSHGGGWAVHSATEAPSPIGILPTTNVIAGDDMLSKVHKNLATLRAFYTFPGGNSVDSFLQENLFLVPILLKARHIIAESFEDNAPLALEIFSDPDEPGSDQLFLFVQTRLPPKQARERLRQLDRQWWLSVVPTVRNKLTIDVEPV